jgi:2-dehydro-3-deoxyphosphogluconate aldolase/(4S)-4-hydroxy-2-oxoglutarate aldolase
MNDPLFPSPLLAQIRSAGVIATVTIDDAASAPDLGRALRDGGIVCVELTLRTPSALDALRRMRSEVPELLVGAGTVLTAGDVREVVKAGAAFGVAPGTNPRVIAAAREAGLPFAPGVCTPSDIELALEAGAKVMKFFPGEPCGGLVYLRSIAAPFAHLGVEFIPLGGVDENNAANYLREPSVAAIGGSWIASRELVQKKAWDPITARAREAVEILRKAR